MLEALLFDLDGTLAHTNPLHYRAWEMMLAELAIDLTPDLYDRHISGRTNAQIVADLLPQLSAAEALALADRKEQRYRELAIDCQPLPGLREFIERACHRGLKLALVTNAPRANAEFMLELLDLKSAFQDVVLAEDAIAGKPDPAPYRLALEHLAVAARDAVVFEDSPPGIRSAVGAGIATVGLMTTHPAGELLEAGAAIVARDFADLEALRSLIGSGWQPPNLAPADRPIADQPSPLLISPIG